MGLGLQEEQLGDYLGENNNIAVDNYLKDFNNSESTVTFRNKFNVGGKGWKGVNKQGGRNSFNQFKKK